MSHLISPSSYTTHLHRGIRKFQNRFGVVCGKEIGETMVVSEANWARVKRDNAPIVDARVPHEAVDASESSRADPGPVDQPQQDKRLMSQWTPSRISCPP